MHRIILFALVLALTVTPCHALTLFQTDYDADEYTSTAIQFNIPDNIPSDWLPLREVSNYLPITVDWDNTTKEIIVKADLYENTINLIREKRYKADNLSTEDLIIVNGVTYCSPRFLTSRLPNVSFRYNGELYYFQGEMQISKLIQGKNEFRNKVLITVYNMRLALPDDYKLIRSCLTGGIKQVEANNNNIFINAYVYPTASKPVAYIVDRYSMSNIPELIAHEAYHVKLKYNTKQNEQLATEYGKKVYYDLRNTINKMGE